MDLQAVIFDMDGLLIDSEPFWQTAGIAVLKQYGHTLTLPQYESSTGLRTKEWLELWFNHFYIPFSEIEAAEEAIIDAVISKIKSQGKLMSGVHHIVNYFLQKDLKLGIATSSPMRLADVVVDMFNLRPVLSAITSAGKLPYGKPHPQVYIDCATELGVQPSQCLAFEDSFNGMIAAKAAKMKCVVVPAMHQNHEQRWGAADLKISSLQNFNDLLLRNM
jgi:beta-phosphoglucomutase-like phosphatase (HAD superfamily)